VPFGALPIRDVTADHVELLRSGRRQVMCDALALIEQSKATIKPPHIRPYAKCGGAGINRLLARVNGLRVRQ
jgi:hypothetical protein